MAKISDMTGDERETHLSMTATERESGIGWEVYCDDPVMIRKFSSIGLELVKDLGDGKGKVFRLPLDQITLRKKRIITDEQRQDLSERARKNFRKTRKDDE
jgi:hypothetical protein